MAFLGRSEPAGLAGSDLLQRERQSSPSVQRSDAARSIASNSLSARTISQDSVGRPIFNSKLASNLEQTVSLDAVINSLWRVGSQAGASARAAAPVVDAPRRAVGLASSDSTPKPGPQNRALSSPRFLAACCTPLQPSAAACLPSTSGSSAEATPAQAATEGPATVRTQAIYTAASGAENIVSSSAKHSAQLKRSRAAFETKSPGVLQDMTSSPAPSRPKQHGLPTVTKVAGRSPQKGTAANALGSLRAQLQAAARQTAAAAADEAECSSAQAPEDDAEHDVSKELRRAIAACNRLRDEMENMAVWGPAVGNLAAAVELEEPEEATPAPAAPLRMRRVSFNLPEPPLKPKVSTAPASTCFASVSPRKVAPWSRQQQPALSKRRPGSQSPHKPLRGSRLPGSPHHCWARPSAQATLHTAPPHLPAASHPARPPQDARDDHEAEEEEAGLLNLVRRLSYERPARLHKRARLSPGTPVPAKLAPAADMVEQELREAFMNSSLAQHWLAGEEWAALDYNGLVLSHTAASAHHAKHREVLERMTASKGQEAAEQLIEQLDREWQQLRSIRQRYASVPTAAQGAGGCGSTEPRQTPAKSILKRRSLGALREILSQMPVCEAEAGSASQAGDNMKALMSMA
ncbi:hypothetical protein COCSUDRAFT_59149 [Coccomyxa subellipsoidea C-169]|uniref:Uncharacterized protein n=1 Tax=Coccomyxa subellipsoidea (strain C-169) TaxID=574566 RepID=I0Z7L0_COCSC|nr:hypothetical protein COCSUDRAFT_59149 [Coccomyxa subellipsoidea C-169]EIE26629.1 hypothetical protein COCSUDRAFT_59149 [Coccomyxa subellipsoidea C-169]|eukprot:XP_005651173.1 hypothetical protein COCSUDRAFT_59149 [Coccomyxa subellipsoidea C-169]